MCWDFTVDIEPPALVNIYPSCGTPIIPLINDWWDIILTDIPAGIFPDSTFVIFDGSRYQIPGGGDSLRFVFYPESLGIPLVPGDTITLCIETMDGPFDYCEPNETTYCCDYPITDTGGPVPTIVRVPDDSISACDPESILVRIISRYPVLENSILLRVDGVDYSTTDPRLYWNDPNLVFTPIPDWNNHDTVFVTLISANDIYGNPGHYVPVSWMFYIDRVAPLSAMIEPSIEYTRNVYQQIIIMIDDELAGVDPYSIELTIDGAVYTYGDFEWIASPDGLGGRICWNPLEHGIEFIAGDTIYISLSVADDPDLCGPNLHLADYMFIVEPWTPCQINPNPFSPNGDLTNDITAFDWPNMTTEPARVGIYTTRNVLVRELDLPPQTNYADYIARAWDGKDKNGVLMPQGLYLYVVISDNRVVCNGTVTLVR
jgi:hypothetical protein